MKPTLSVQTAGIVAQEHGKPANRNPLTWALLLLPLAGAGRLRRKGLRMTRLLAMMLFFLAGLAGTAALTGCGSHNGFFGQVPQNYTVNVMATSGTVQHASSVTLNVQ